MVLVSKLTKAPQSYEVVHASHNLSDMCGQSRVIMSRFISRTLRHLQGFKFVPSNLTYLVTVVIMFQANAGILLMLHNSRFLSHSFLLIIH
jgi:hypothetical protein